MTPRDIIAHEMKSDFGLFGSRAPLIYADTLIATLTAAGYSIIRDSENHGPTLERAAEWHEAEAKRLGPDSAFSRLHRSCASAIRAMTTGVQNETF